jgi:hypothetical protein
VSEVRIKLSASQLDALEIAGAFEEPMDEDDALLLGSVRGSELVTSSPATLARIICDLGNGADACCEDGICDDTVLRRGYRRDRASLQLLSHKLWERAADNQGAGRGV